MAYLSVILLGIIAAAIAKYKSYRDFSKLHDNVKCNISGNYDKNTSARRNINLKRDLNDFRFEWGVRKWITGLGLIPDLFLPILFILVWFTVLGNQFFTSISNFFLHFLK